MTLTSFGLIFADSFGCCPSLFSLNMSFEFAGRQGRVINAPVPSQVRWLLAELLTARVGWDGRLHPCCGGVSGWVLPWLG